MSLVKCPECGRDNVSDSSESCPSCGYNVKRHFDSMKENARKQKIQEELKKESDRMDELINMKIEDNAKNINLPSKRPSINIFIILSCFFFLLCFLFCLVQFKIIGDGSDCIIPLVFCIFGAVVTLYYGLEKLNKDKKMFDELNSNPNEYKRMIAKKNGISTSDMNEINHIIAKERNNLPELKKSIDETLHKNNNVLKCPKCGSTAVTTGQRGFSMWTGFLGSNKTVNRCGNCGCTFYPKN